MSTSDRVVFQTLIDEGFNHGNLPALDALFTADFVEHQDGITPPNLTGLKGSIAYLRNAFPDLHLTIEEFLVDGDKGCARIVGRGTHQGPLMGRPGDGRAFAINVIDICRFQDGKIAEHWGVADQFSLIRQLGLLPWPA